MSETCFDVESLALVWMIFVSGSCEAPYCMYCQAKTRHELDCEASA